MKIEDRFRQIVRLEENCQTAKLIFTEPERSANKELVAEFIQELIKQANIKSFTFLLPDQTGKGVEFTLENSTATRAGAAKNGTLSFQLAKREVERLKGLTGQLSNHCNRKAVTYGFRPEEPDDFNFTIFYTKDLLHCIIEIKAE